MPGSGSEGLVQRCTLGDLQEPDLCGDLSNTCVKNFQLKADTDRRQIFQMVILPRYDRNKNRHLYLRDM